MKKLILTLSLVSSLAASAQTFLCPSQVLCTNDGTKTTCTAGSGSPWFNTFLSNVSLPANTSQYFQFQSASANEMIKTQPHVGCTYNTGSAAVWLTFSTNYNVIGDVKAAGNNWQSTFNGMTTQCTGSTGQCPFVEVATK